MSSLYLVRHGITAANRENRFAGRSDEELHPEGIVQMQQTGTQLRQKNIGAIYCGPAKRTWQSAEILGEMFSLPVSCRADFDEIHIPHWDGLTKDEIRQRFGAQYPTWLAAPQKFEVSGCETLSQVQQRAVAGVKQIIAERQDQNLLLVSHLIVLRCLVLYFRGIEISEFRTIQIKNGTILQLEQQDKNGFDISSMLS